MPLPPARQLAADLGVNLDSRRMHRQEQWGFAGRFIALAPVMAIVVAFMIAIRRGMVCVPSASACVPPLDMSKLASRRGNADRFRLGGLLYFDRENPLLLVRGRLWVHVQSCERSRLRIRRLFGGLIAIALRERPPVE